MDLRSLFLKNVAQTTDEALALHFPKAEGVYLYDANNKPYIDFISGIAVSNVGHRHKKVIKAIKNQADQYLHQMVYGEFIQAPQVKLAAKLVKGLANYSTSSYGKLDNVYFTNSGTEAIEGAMKLAKKFTGRPEIISLNKAYHGSSQGALSLGDEFFKTNFRPLLPGIKKIERNVLEDLNKITQETAAVIIEPIGGESGVIESNLAYLKALAAKCNETKTLLIFDEVQTGIGRTGKLWAFEHYGIVPDLIISAKGLGGGMPIGAFIAPKEIMQAFTENPFLGHITTFGGHPVSCAAALATLEIIEEEINLQEVLAKGQLIKSLLVHPKIKEVRGIGLLMAAELGTFEEVKETMHTCIKNGLITDWFLYCDNAIRIAPPLTIAEDEIRTACSIILKALNS